MPDPATGTGPHEPQPTASTVSLKDLAGELKVPTWELLQKLESLGIFVRDERVNIKNHLAQQVLESYGKPRRGRYSEPNEDNPDPAAQHRNTTWAQTARSSNAGRLHGRVRFFESSRRYGFISGADGVDYFFHATELSNTAAVTADQLVTFEPGASTRGPRARRVEAAEDVDPSPRQQQSNHQPHHFITTRKPTVHGFDIVQIVAPICSHEAYDPNEAREGLQRHAAALGANAIVNLHLEKYSKSPEPLILRVLGIAPNYYQTMHRFSGTAVIINRRMRR